MLLARLSSPLARFPFFHNRASSVFLMLLLLPRAAAPWILGDSCRMEKNEFKFVQSLELVVEKGKLLLPFFCFRIFVCVCVFSSSFPYPSLLSIYFLSLSFSLSSILVSFSTPFSCTFFSPIFSSVSFFFTFPLRILDIPLLSLLFPGSFNNRIQKCIFALK